MDNFSKYIDNIVEKALNEALEAKADQIVSEIAKKVETTEKLHGRQSELDKNKNNKIDAGDFKLLRKKKPMKEYTMGDDDIEGVKPYGDFETDSPKKVGKVKNVGYNYEKKVAKEFNESKFLGQNRGDKEYWTDERDREYTGGFDFDYDEEEFDDYDSFTEKAGNQRWFQSGDQSDSGRRIFNTYRDKWGPLKLRKKRMDIGEEDRDEFDGRPSKVIGVYSDIKKQRMGEQGETEEGNAFSGALAKAKKEGKDSFTVDGKKYEVTEKWKGNVDVKQTGQYSDMTIDDLDKAIKKLKDKTQKLKDDGKKVPHTDKTKMSQLYFAKRAKKDWPGKGKAKVNESVKLTENEIIDLIERIVMEQSNISKKSSSVEPDFNKVEKKNKEVNDKHIKDTVKKMKEYLKDASEGEYDMEPKKFPRGNGEMKETPKKAYKASDAVEEYIDDFAYPGMTNLVYDEIKPNDEWIEANLKGSSKTGNAQVDKDGNALGNVVPSELGEKMYKNFEDNVYGAEQMNASYKRYPQPVDQAGESTEQGDLKLKKGAKKSQDIFKKLGESKENKQEKLISEEIQKMKSLVDYNKKTQ
jgi:hypothetical protein